MFERFTDRSRRVVILAQQEARVACAVEIGTEHIEAIPEGMAKLDGEWVDVRAKPARP